MNKVELIGNAASEKLFVGVSVSGKAFAVFQFATDYKELTDFHAISVWDDRTIAYLKENYRKGMRMFIEGAVTYQVKRNEEGKVTEKACIIRAKNIINLSAKQLAPEKEAVEAA